MLIIIGTGAVASELTLFADEEIKGYLEYSYNIDKYYKKYRYDKPVLGDMETYPICRDDYFAIGIADITFRKKVIEVMQKRGAKFANIVSSKAIVDPKSIIGRGNVISPYCIIESNVMLGNFNHLTATAIISHDSEIGNNNVFSAALLCGHVKVKDNNRFCIKSTVIPDITIGSGNTISAGMVVNRNLKDNERIFYWYKESIIKR